MSWDSCDIKIGSEEESEHFARLFFTLLGNDERYRASDGPSARRHGALSARQLSNIQAHRPTFLFLYIHFMLQRLASLNKKWAYTVGNDESMGESSDEGIFVKICTFYDNYSIGEIN